MSTELQNAFLGRPQPPSPSEVAAALGPTAALWDEIVNRITQDEAITAQEWKGVCVNKYGWSLRLLHKKRNVVYLSPCAGCFRVAFVFGEKAMLAVREASFPAAVAKLISSAPKYPEGTGLRLLVKHRSDLPPIFKLAHIKLLS
jgi:hypothetical protein